MSESKLVECVPNFSEGRDRGKIDAILDVVRAVPGVKVLDVDPGAETNRTVVTLIGPPETIGEAAFLAVKRASELIDMRSHRGAHPRHGATDVLPFVPVSGVSMDDCVAIARAVGRRIGDELGIPVYLYEHAASRPERRSLAAVRAGEYEALPDKLGRPEWKPDFGPARFHAQAGVVTVGAREFLIAYNVNLNSRTKAHADDLAGELRETGRAVRRGQTSAWYDSGKLLRYEPAAHRMPCGYCASVERDQAALARHYQSAHGLDLAEELAFFGRDAAALEGVNVMKRGRFRHCRAVGWVIPEYGRAQISINLTDFRVTPAHAVLDACRELARERGLLVTGSEIVGLLPWEALEQSGRHYLHAQGSSRGLPVADIVQTAVQSLGLDDVATFDPQKAVLGLPRLAGPLVTQTLSDFTDEVSRPSPAPGGGSVAALAGALAAALGAMVANLTHGKRGPAAARDEMEMVAMALQQVKHELLVAVDADTEAFGDVLAAMRLPRDTEAQASARAAALQAGYQRATSVPLRTAQLCLEALRHCRTAAEQGLPASVSDAGVGALMARAGLRGAVANVRINLPAITDAAWVSAQRSQLEALLAEAEALEQATMARVDALLEAPARAG